MGLICSGWFGISFPNENISAAERQMIAIMPSRQPPATCALEIDFRNSTLWPLMGMYFCIQWANYFYSLMPVYLQEGRGFSENSMKKITSLLLLWALPDS
jgi:hypothetical protein